MHNAIGIDVKGDLNLGHASRGGGNAHKLELAQLLVVSCHLTLPLEDLDAHLGLVVCRCAEGLRLLGGDCCIPANIASHKHGSAGPCVVRRAVSCVPVLMLAEMA